MIIIYVKITFFKLNHIERIYENWSLHFPGIFDEPEVQKKIIFFVFTVTSE